MEFTTDVLDEEEVTAQETAEELSLTTDIYAEIRARLALRGIPRGEVAFIHDARTPAARKALFEAVNLGEIRVLIGSTEKMGTGMNVQERCIAMHTLTPPWRPGDIEQQVGRMWRQGNQVSPGVPVRPPHRRQLRRLCLPALGEQGWLHQPDHERECHLARTGRRGRDRPDLLGDQGAGFRQPEDPAESHAGRRAGSPERDPRHLAERESGDAEQAALSGLRGTVRKGKAGLVPRGHSPARCERQ